jgi:hypothetical protein
MYCCRVALGVYDTATTVCFLKDSKFEVVEKGRREVRL